MFSFNTPIKIFLLFLLVLPCFADVVPPIESPPSPTPEPSAEHAQQAQELPPQASPSPTPYPILTAEGLLLPRNQAKLASQVDGVVEEILVKEGQFVQKNEPILTLNAREQQLRVRFAEQSARKAANDLESARRLLAENLISRTEFERAEIEKAAAEANLGLATLQKDYHILKAPFPGHILRIHKKPGESVQRFETLADIANCYDMIALVYLEAIHLPKVHRGQTVLVTPLLGDNPETLEGNIEFADPVVDPGTGIFRVKIALRTPSDTPTSVPTGIRARVQFLPSQ
ncbi:MAG: efflux RND transporter periplasmic adaptor subunit [Chthoniobacterales bacterium]|nr:efflux RND transporter periplasmic adaptor subunit [Chthoniobacterales bacterium]MCX7713183.1 efflux RND transporter periplasmic adaptor subunit [Chthoniobacterales bacterium]